MVKRGWELLFCAHLFHFMLLHSFWPSISLFVSLLLFVLLFCASQESRASEPRLCGLRPCWPGFLCEHLDCK